VSTIIVFSLLDQPFNIIAEGVNVASNGKDFDAVTAAPGLNAPDFAAVAQHAVVPTPAAEGSDFLSRFDAHVCLYRLLKRHEKTSPYRFACLPRGNENLPKAYENNRKLSSKIFVTGKVFFSDETAMI
jgi:hypothetical protein